MHRNTLALQVGFGACGGDTGGSVRHYEGRTEHKSHTIVYAGVVPLVVKHCPRRATWIVGTMANRARWLLEARTRLRR